MIKRILLVNKFYYPSGGYCVVTLNTQSLLRCRGHEVGGFSMKYPENIESEWSKYFAGEVNFSGGHEKKMAAVKRTLGMSDVTEMHIQKIEIKFW